MLRTRFFRVPVDGKQRGSSVPQRLNVNCIANMIKSKQGDDRGFLKEKAGRLSKIDLSKKGSVDEYIRDLVSLLNESLDYYTTSSCSGRIILVAKSDFRIKKGCVWLWHSHDAVWDTSELREKSCNHSGDAELKFEPFVMHICCSTLDKAKALLSAAIGSGFRNSGMTVSGKNRIIVAVRSTHSLQVPISLDGKLLVSLEYIDHVVNLANQKLEENHKRIDNFLNIMRDILTNNNSNKESYFPS